MVVVVRGEDVWDALCPHFNFSVFVTSDHDGHHHNDLSGLGLEAQQTRKYFNPCFLTIFIYSTTAFLVLLVAWQQLWRISRLLAIHQKAHHFVVWHGEWLRTIEFLAVCLCVAIPIVRLIALDLRTGAWILFTAINSLAWICYGFVIQIYPEAYFRRTGAHRVLRTTYTMRAFGVLLAVPATLDLWSRLAYDDFERAESVAAVAQIGAVYLHVIVACLGFFIPFQPQIFSRQGRRGARNAGGRYAARAGIHQGTRYGSSTSGGMNMLLSQPQVLSYASVDTTTTTDTSAENAASLFSKLGFLWADPLLHFGYLCRMLRYGDLLAMPRELDTEFLCDQFSKTVFAKRSSPEIKHPVLSAFNSTYGSWYYPLAILKLLADGAGFAGPLLLHELVTLIETDSSDYSSGYMYAGLLCVITAFGSMCNVHYSFQSSKVQVAVRAAVTSTIYRKALRSRLNERASSDDATNTEEDDAPAATVQSKKQPQQVVQAISVSIPPDHCGRGMKGGSDEDDSDSDEAGEGVPLLAPTSSPFLRAGASRRNAGEGSSSSNTTTTITTQSKPVPSKRDDDPDNKNDDNDDNATGDDDLSSHGGVMNLMSTDADRIANFCPSFHQFWSLPFQIAVSLYLLYQQIGVSFLAGVAFVILLIPINKHVANKIGSYGETMMREKDKRVKLTGEVLAAMRVIRMYAWDILFEKTISRIRRKELRALKGRKYLDAVCVYLWATTPILISISSFATYVALGNKLTASTVFTSLALFNMLIGPLNAFPWVLNGMVEAWVSLGRVQRFLRLKYSPSVDDQPLLLDEADGFDRGTCVAFDDATLSPAGKPGAPQRRQESHAGQEAACSNSSSFKHIGSINAGSDVAFVADDDDDDGRADHNRGEGEAFPLLHSLSFALPFGALAVVEGGVGSGKSTLLLAMLGEEKPEEGSVYLHASVLQSGVGYVPQEPWIMNGTIRQNILCDQAYDASYYHSVLQACALDHDLVAISGGDFAELGENGVNLSGGQKARISLARAVYQRKHMYILDNPLAALDDATSETVFLRCILGLLSDACVVLCTEHPLAREKADFVLTIEHHTVRFLRQETSRRPHVPVSYTSSGNTVDPSIQTTTIDGGEASSASRSDIPPSDDATRDSTGTRGRALSPNTGRRASEPVDDDDKLDFSATGSLGGLDDAIYQQFDEQPSYVGPVSTGNAHTSNVIILSNKPQYDPVEWSDDDADARARARADADGGRSRPRSGSTGSAANVVEGGEEEDEEEEEEDFFSSLLKHSNEIGSSHELLDDAGLADEDAMVAEEQSVDLFGNDLPVKAHTSEAHAVNEAVREGDDSPALYSLLSQPFTLRHDEGDGEDGVDATTLYGEDVARPQGRRTTSTTAQRSRLSRKGTLSSSSLLSRPSSSRDARGVIAHHQRPHHRLAGYGQHLHMDESQYHARPHHDSGSDERVHSPFSPTLPRSRSHHHSSSLARAVLSPRSSRRLTKTESQASMPTRQQSNQSATSHESGAHRMHLGSIGSGQLGPPHAVAVPSATAAEGNVFVSESPYAHVASLAGIRSKGLDADDEEFAYTLDDMDDFSTGDEDGNDDDVVGMDGDSDLSYLSDDSDYTDYAADSASARGAGRSDDAGYGHGDALLSKHSSENPALGRGKRQKKSRKSKQQQQQMTLQASRWAEHGAPGSLVSTSLDKKRRRRRRQRKQNRRVRAGRLFKKEDRSVGVVSKQVYMAYVKAVGHVLAVLVLAAVALMQTSKNVSDWWLSYWVTHATPAASGNRTITDGGAMHATPVSRADALGDYGLNGTTEYLETYAAISATNTVFTLLRAFLFAYAGVVAARSVHSRLLGSVLRARISFFDSNPIGRIINRFSSDINAVDDSLPFILNILLAQGFGLVGTIAVMCYSQPYFLFLLLPLAALYYRIQRYYRQTSREVKRIGSIARSPIYAHFSESLTGTVSVRAMKMERQFELENVRRMHANQTASYNEQVVAQWLGIRLQAVGVLMLTGIAFLTATQHHVGSADPGLAGLAISYALSVTGLLQNLVTAFTETEKEMVAVERCEYFIRTRSEKQLDIAPARLPVEWPSAGNIVFDKVTVRYRTGLNPSLSEFSVSVTPGTKVGIVGRTGAGKSTIINALLRMVDFTGSIRIDGVDILEVDRHTLRKQITVVPQDPVLFSGTLRFNLDPFNEHTDDELWHVLDQCCLLESVGKWGRGLRYEVKERGSNLSVGEKQLVSIARGLLRGCKIVCIDEATANVDRETDERVQRAIAEGFSQCTVITIAHRIHTLKSCQWIMTISDGRLVRYTTVNDFFASPNLVDEVA